MTEKDYNICYTKAEFIEKFNFDDDNDFNFKINKWRKLYKIDPLIFRNGQSPRSHYRIPYEIAPLLALHLKTLHQAPLYRKNAKLEVNISEIAKYNKIIYDELKLLPNYAKNFVFEKESFLEAYKMTNFLPVLIEYFSLFFASLIQSHGEVPNKIMTKIIYQLRNWIFEFYKNGCIDTDAEIPAYTPAFSPDELEDILLPFPDLDFYVETATAKKKHTITPDAKLPSWKMKNDDIKMATFDDSIIRAILELNQKQIGETFVESYLDDLHDAQNPIEQCSVAELREALNNKLEENCTIDKQQEAIKEIDQISVVLKAQFSFPLRNTRDEYIRLNCKRKISDINFVSVADVIDTFLKWKQINLVDSDETTALNKLNQTNFMEMWNSMPHKNLTNISDEFVSEIGSTWDQLYNALDLCEQGIIRLKKRPYYKIIKKWFSVAIGQMYMGMMYFEQESERRKE